eukprot:TRINITY_DN2880_c0_g1_i1.p2 TRINITY_DN2880_c0_g1~~TRINITY_DN2880_c0_g1_i1.p2  ORF type:complete len:139 (+),score=29.91 TRINITY_DN2880_c0_g1_i1:111-527(+)
MSPKPVGAKGKRVKPVHKRTKRFNRHQSDRFDRVGPSWRKQKGIDSAVRRRWRGWPLMPNIGYGTAKAHRNIHPDGFLHFPIQRVEDLDMLFMQRNRFAAVIGHAVSAANRREILKRASILNVKVVNNKARLAAKESA